MRGGSAGVRIYRLRGSKIDVVFSSCFYEDLGLISEHSGTDVEMIFATKLDRNFGVP